MENKDYNKRAQVKPKGSRENNFTFSAPIHLTQQRCENVGISRIFAPC
jgi:hypothetical protein